jgi:hypothetical protein
VLLLTGLRLVLQADLAVRVDNPWRRKGHRRPPGWPIEVVGWVGIQTALVAAGAPVPDAVEKVRYTHYR